MVEFKIIKKKFQLPAPFIKAGDLFLVKFPQSPLLIVYGENDFWFSGKFYLDYKIVMIKNKIHIFKKIF